MQDMMYCVSYIKLPDLKGKCSQKHKDSDLLRSFSICLIFFFDPNDSLTIYFSLLPNKADELTLAGQSSAQRHYGLLALQLRSCRRRGQQEEQLAAVQRGELLKERAVIVAFKRDE